MVSSGELVQWWVGNCCWGPNLVLNLVQNLVLMQNLVWNLEQNLVSVQNLVHYLVVLMVVNLV